jgi:hypothetical protein
MASFVGVLGHAVEKAARVSVGGFDQEGDMARGGHGEELNELSGLKCET